MKIQTTKPSFARSVHSCFPIACIAGLMSIALIVSGCATQAPVKGVEETPEMVWPKPPEQAVIRYIGEVREIEKLDIEDRSSFRDILAGKETRETAQTLSKPYGVYGDDKGRLFVADTALGALLVFDTEADTVERWGEVGLGALKKPIAITSDKFGRVFVCDVGDTRVVIFDQNGKYLSAFGGPDVFENPVAIAVNDQLGHIYVVDSKGHQIIVFDLDGNKLTSFGEKGNLPGYFMYPTDIAIGSDNRLFISDSLNFRIQILEADGTYIKHFGKVGLNPGDLSRPKGIALDRDGHVYVVDASFFNFQVFDEDGNLLLIVGQGGSGPGQFVLPTDIHIDHRGRIYVADQINHRVQIFEYLGRPDLEPASE